MIGAIGDSPVLIVSVPALLSAVAALFSYRYAKRKDKDTAVTTFMERVQEDNKELRARVLILEERLARAEAALLKVAQAAVLAELLKAQQDE